MKGKNTGGMVVELTKMANGGSGSRPDAPFGGYWEVDEVKELNSESRVTADDYAGDGGDGEGGWSKGERGWGMGWWRWNEGE